MVKDQILLKRRLITLHDVIAWKTAVWDGLHSYYCTAFW